MALSKIYNHKKACKFLPDNKNLDDAHQILTYLTETPNKTEIRRLRRRQLICCKFTDRQVHLSP